MRGKGLVAIYILEILERHASPRKKLSQEEIIRYLDEDYNLSITRKTLSGYLAELREEGYIAGYRGLYKVNLFEDNELRLLIDGVLFGQHIPKIHADKLIEKLKNLAYQGLKNRIKHVCYLESINHTSNDKLYEIIDVIDEAIESERKIEITSCAYKEDGKLYDRGTKVVDPYYLVTEKSRYYLICYTGRDEDVENRRLDRISNVKILQETRMPIDRLEKYRNGFDLGKYMKEHIYMFTGESIPVEIKIKRDRIGDFIDWFGMDYRIKKQEEAYVTLRIIVNEHAVYYWAMQYGEIAEVVSPVTLRKRIYKGVKTMMERYEEEKVDEAGSRAKNFEK